MRLQHVGICVRDMEESIQFYRDGLGLSLFQDQVISGPDVDAGLMERDARVRMVIFMDEAGNMIELFEWENPVAIEKPPEHKRFTSVGIAEVSLLVDDLEEAGKRLAETGFYFRNDVWDFGKGTGLYGGAYARIQYVEDPSGVQVELMEIVAADTL